MSKVADIKLGWTRSPSADITSRKIVINKNGETSTIDLPAEVSEYLLEVPALASVSFNTIVFDSEGKQVSSETYSFNVGDLESPLPDTLLFHEIVAVRDVEPTPMEGKK